ncbi:hypothetical protein MRX96_034316 [Rhipicephalus microplus]
MNTEAGEKGAEEGRGTGSSGYESDQAEGSHLRQREAPAVDAKRKKAYAHKRRSHKDGVRGRALIYNRAKGAREGERTSRRRCSGPSPQANCHQCLLPPAGRYQTTMQASK